MGNGYIYSSQFQDGESAEQELLSSIAGETINDVRHFDLPLAKRKVIWHKNCFALGLAAGFLEPLESLGLSLIQTALSKLYTFFPDQTFNEYDIVYTKSPITQDDFCFVNFKGKNINLKKNQKFRGEFKGLFSDKTQCINGEIYLSPVEKIEKQMKKANKVIQRTNRIADSLKEKANPLKIMDTLKMNVLRKSETLSVFSKFKTIRLEIYDGGQEDGDKIDVLNNGELILKDYEITSKRKPISILLAKAKTSIVLKAKNVGSMSTNTAVLEFFIGDQKIRALTNLKAGETTQIDVYLKE